MTPQPSNPQNTDTQDELTYGIDFASPGGDETAITIKSGSELFTYSGREAKIIIALINSEILKLLDGLEKEKKSVMIIDDYKKLDLKNFINGTAKPYVAVEAIPLSALQEERQRYE